MIKVLDRSFNELGALLNLKDGMVSKVDSGSWSINITVIQDDPSAEYLVQNNYLLYENQKFTIRDVSTERKGEERYVIVSAEHVFFELEEHVIPEAYQFTGTIGQHINKLLSYQNGSDFVYEAGGTGTMYSIRRLISIDAGTIAQNLKKILDHFFARLVLDNYKVRPIPQLQTSPSNVVLEYGVQNADVSRTYSRDDVVTRVVCIADIDGETITTTFNASNIDDYRNPITKVLDLGVLDSQQDMNWIASEYLAVNSSPDATYNLSFAELKNLDDINVYYPGRNFAIDTGMAVTVLDGELGFDQILPVKSYSYSLVNPNQLSHVTLGSLRKMRIPEEKEKTNTLEEERQTLVWAEAVMGYVHEVLGGSLRDVNPELLSFTASIGGRKTIARAASKLRDIHPGYDGLRYNRPVVIKEPISEIRKRRKPSVATASGIITQYIRNVAGSPSAGTIVSIINDAYRINYGLGQQVSYPDDTVASVFGDQFEVGTSEYFYADRVIGSLKSRVGNLSEIYLEIGGGNTGVVGAINDLYDKLIKPEITVSADAPDDSYGKDGDLWFQYSDDEDD